MWGRRPPKQIRDALTAIPTWTDYQAKLKSEGKFKLAPAKDRASGFTVNAEINGKVTHWTGDITELKIDAVVNAANSWLAPGGGICGAIHGAAGPELADECEAIGGCDTGNTVITKGYRLPAKHVLHTVGPTNGSEDALRSCYQTCLDVSVKNGVRSLAFCCIATGIYGYPNRAAAQLALRTVRTWLETGDNRTKIDRIIFCTFMDIDVQLYDRFMSAYFPVDASDVALTDEEKAQLPPVVQPAAAVATAATPAVAGEETKVSAEAKLAAEKTAAVAAAATPAVAGAATTTTTTATDVSLERRPSGVTGMDLRSDSNAHTLPARTAL